MTHASEYLREKFMIDEDGDITPGIYKAIDVIELHGGEVILNEIYNPNDGFVLPDIYWDAVNFLIDEWNYKIM